MQSLKSFLLLMTSNSSSGSLLDSAKKLSFAELNKWTHRTEIKITKDECLHCLWNYVHLKIWGNRDFELRYLLSYSLNSTSLYLLKEWKMLHCLWRNRNQCHIVTDIQNKDFFFSTKACAIKQKLTLANQLTHICTNEGRFIARLCNIGQRMSGW